jgi:hypothetical protein
VPVCFRCVIFSAFKLEIHGFAVAKWGETRSNGGKSSTMNFTGKEDYLRTGTILVDSVDGIKVKFRKS